jgi:DNA polymerase III subunit epsilon
MKLQEIPLFFLDTQTTGSNPESARLLEVAWGLFDDEDVFSTLIRLPEGEALPRRISMITGIKAEDLNAGVLLSEFAKQISDFMKQHESTIAVIHFARFEIPFLEKYLFNDFPDTRKEVLCTYEIARRLHPNLPSRGIKALAGYYGYPTEELKRASEQVRATRTIWKGLLADLSAAGIQTLSELREWLRDTPIPKKTRYEYRLSRELRLALPTEPGIYKMLGKNGQVLYVGKATSLRSRVNSYFRGQKGRDSKKLEMLTQVWDLQTVICPTPLEAALLETDEIKRLNPPYNIALKEAHRSLNYYSRDFLSVTQTRDEKHPNGPISGEQALEVFFKIQTALKSSESLEDIRFTEDLFYEEVSEDLLLEGFRIFLSVYGLPFTSLRSLRTQFAFGGWRLRIRLRQEREERALALREMSEVDPLDDGEGEIEREDRPPTPEEIAEKFERHFTRGAATLRRARALTRLLNSEIAVESADGEKRLLQFREGKLVTNTRASQSVIGTGSAPWKDLSIDTFDRMVILRTEVEKQREKNGR